MAPPLGAPVTFVVGVQVRAGRVVVTENNRTLLIVPRGYANCTEFPAVTDLGGAPVTLTWVKSAPLRLPAPN